MCSILKRSLIRKTFVSLHLKNCMSLPATSLQYSSSSTILKLSKKEFKLRRLHCSNTLFAHASQRSFLLLNESSWGTKYLHTMTIMFTKSDENNGLPERQRLKESSKQSMCTEDALSVSTDEVDTDTRVEISGDDPVSSLSSEKWSDYFDDYNFEDLLENIHKKQAKREEEQLRKAKKRGVADLMSIEELVEFLKLENAQDVCVIHVSPDKQYVDYLVTCTGVSTRHIKRMADALATEVKTIFLNSWYRGFAMFYVSIIGFFESIITVYNILPQRPSSVSLAEEGLWAKMFCYKEYFIVPMMDTENDCY